MAGSKQQSIALVSAMTVGWVLGGRLEPALPAVPYIISAMLLVTFIEVRPRDLALRRSHLWLLLVQTLLATASYLVGLHTLGHYGALGMLMCTMIPAATAGPVVVRLLGGQAGYTTTYVLLSHLLIVVIAPIVLPVVGGQMAGESFLPQALAIFYRVASLILPALAGAWLLRYLAPKPAAWLSSQRWLSLGLWIASLVILMGHTSRMMHDGVQALAQMQMMAIIALGLCLLQFALGHYLAGVLGMERAAVRHSLGQKNTTMGIWLATLFLPPPIAMANAAYIVWQNIMITLLLGRLAARRRD